MAKKYNASKTYTLPPAVLPGSAVPCGVGNPPPAPDFQHPEVSSEMAGDPVVGASV